MTMAIISILFLICICGIFGKNRLILRKISLKKKHHLGNAIVLIVGICKRKYQNNVTNCYIMNLAITDLLFLLFSVPLTIYLAIRQVWIFGEFICKINIYLAHVCVIFSINIL